VNILESRKVKPDPINFLSQLNILSQEFAVAENEVTGRFFQRGEEADGTEEVYNELSR
jgi:hypothetical protein